jgi:hypothetical protein
MAEDSENPIEYLSMSLRIDHRHAGRGTHLANTWYRTHSKTCWTINPVAKDQAPYPLNANGNDTA